MTKDHTKCLQKVRQEIINADKSVQSVYFDLSNICEFIGSKKVKQNKTGQRVTIMFNHTKKDKSIVVKQNKSFVSHTYCPFCGKKY